MSKLLLATPTDPKLLSNLLDEQKEIITKITLISVDFPPIEVLNGIDTKINNDKKLDQSVFNKKQDQAAMFDVVGLIVDISPINSSLKSFKDTNNNIDKKTFIIANEVMFISHENSKLISINGDFNVLPNELISKIYTNFPELKSSDLNELEDLLEVSKDETAIKAFYKLGHYFTAKKYEINNNIFSLIEHQEQAEAVAKKVLLKKMVAWEIRK
ncbi:MMOB1640 family gliding machinery internal complex protein [Mesomycoplasma moatsii]|uniref:MMOB1640 family gliding machinery internal complex protein n=1 Tax=Mesomycoplasma moatsii TaxID=171287 RepID=UPI0003B4E5B6